MTTTVDQWTNAELARWMAERDVTPEMAETWGGLDRAINAVLDHEGDPTDSLDAAVAWIERRVLHWSRYQSYWPSVAVSTGIDERPCNWKTCYESPNCPTARALCIASIKAQMDVEAKR